MATRKLLLFEWVCLFLVFGIVLGSANEYDYECEDILDQASRFPPSNVIATHCCSGKGLRYECINGYQLVSGDQKRLCQNGNLTGTEPRCEFPKVTSCGNPGPVMYGYFIGSNFNISSRVTYKCHNGFTMHGHSRRTCMENGMWSEPPQCSFDDETAVDIDTATEVISNSIQHSLYETKCSEPGPGCQSTSLSRRRRGLDVNHAAGLDLVFMFDGSSSVKKDEFKMGLRFAQELVRVLDATGRRGGVKVAALTYSSGMKINFRFIYTSDRILKKLSSIKRPGGCGSNLGRSMFLLRKGITPGVRRGSKRALFIVSSGRLILGTSHKRAARLLKTENSFQVYVIGIGKSPKLEELSKLVTEPVKEHIIVLKAFADVFGSVKKAVARSRKNPSNCGISNTKPKSRTIRGNKAASGAWPWQIGIYWDRARIPICGGALIGDQWVLTAAHCFYSSARKAITWPPWRYTVIAGQETSKRESGKQMAPVAKIYVNKNFRYHTNQNDIALVQLQYKFKTDKHIRPVCLPSKNTKGKKTSAGKHGFVAEWDRRDGNGDGSKSKAARRRNRSRVLVHTALVISPPQQCLNMTSKPFNSSLMFCAMDRKTYKQNCRGDGGSPFVSEKYDKSTSGYRFYIDGLVSWDEKCGTDKHHRFFTRVDPYAHWIKKIMRDSRRP